MHACVQVHDAFATLLEVLACQQQHAAASAASNCAAADMAANTSGAAATADYHAFVESTSRQLLAVSYTRKGRCAGWVCAGRVYWYLVTYNVFIRWQLLLAVTHPAEG